MKYINERKKSFIVPKDIKKLNDIFNENGYKLYIAGGSIRDFLTGDIPKDYDLATDALPKDVINILKDYKLNLQGEKFAVVVVYTKDFPEGLEVATFRKDVSKGRNPEIETNVSIETDVNRRDITINSIFYDIEKREIIDLVGGEEDLKNKVIRTVGDPKQRIEEDKLRILRIIRFATRYGSTISNDTKQSIKDNNILEDISDERIWDIKNGEFIKGYYQAKDFQEYLDYLTEFDLWDQILPGYKINSKIKDSSSLVIVLAQILKGNSIKKLNKLPFSSNLIGQIIFLHSLENFDSKNVLKYYKEKVRYKVSNKDISIWLNINNLNIDKFLKYKPSISADYVMKKYNISPSPKLGQYISELETDAYENL